MVVGVLKVKKYIDVNVMEFQIGAHILVPLGLVNVKEKTCFQKKSKFITGDYFVQHMNITIIKFNKTN